MAAFLAMRAGVLVMHEADLLIESSPSKTGQQTRKHFALCAWRLESIETVVVLDEEDAKVGSLVWVVVMGEEEETVSVGSFV